MLRATLLVLAWAIATNPATHAAPPSETGSTPRKAPSELAARVWEITDVILDHHVDPPARQEMILVAIRSVYLAARLEPPVGLARQVSVLSGPEPLAPLLDEAWSRLPAGKIHVRDVEIEPVDQLIEGLVEPLPGGARVLSAQELKVEEQFAGNRYVGLHIAVAFDKEAKRVSIAQVFKGGPADLAGVKDGDLIEEIDGVGTDGLTVQKVVERLRGPEGSQVTIRVRQPKDAVARVFTITRGALPRSTVKGVRDRPDGSAEVLLSSSEPIGYVKIEEILGSTPHELRKLARQLEEEGAKALVLDLRQVSQAHLHPTVLLADSLLDGGTIGAMRTSHGVETFRAEPDALFSGWPLAVLLDNHSSPTVHWLAAALQDNHRAIIVGLEEPRGVRPRGPGRGPVLRDNEDDYVRSAVPIGDGSSSIKMATGRLQRGDGRLLVATDGDTKNNLVPDFLVGAATTFFTPEDKLRTEPRDKGDITLAAAVQRLRTLLKSP